MLDRNRLPTPLMEPGERPPIPIVDGKTIMAFRRLRGSFRLTGLVLKLIFLKLFGRLDAGALGRLIGDFCQRMGVLWVKLGQLMSMRSDLFPRELCAELARLQDRVEGFSPLQARRILEKELGGPLTDFFSRWEELPSAAASIAQVHRGYLKKEKTWVAVKVRRPGIDRVFDKDMALIRGLFHLLHRFSIMSYMRWTDMLWELEQVFNEELDYRYEMVNQQRLRKSLARHDIYAPRVYERYCTRKVLSMEYIEAVSMADYLHVLKKDPDRLRRWVKENGIDAGKVGRNMLRSFLRQVLEDNLFHADLHPGNIFLLRDSRIALLDFGSIGSSEGDMMRKYNAYLETLSTGQYAKAIDLFLLMMPGLPATGLVQAKEELQYRLHAWDSRCRVKEIPYSEKSASWISDEMTRVMAKYGVTINWAFFKVLRGWTTMDASLRDLIPEGDLPRLVQSYQDRRRKRELKAMIRQLPGDLLKLQNLIDYPRESSEMAIYRGASVRRLAQVFEGAATRVSKLAAMVFGMGSAFCFFFAAAFSFLALFQHTKLFAIPAGRPLLELLKSLPTADPQVWILLIVFFMQGYLSLGRLARRFRRQE